MDRITSTGVIAALLLLGAGCAADELDPREAAYPEPIGVTLPRQTTSARAAGAPAATDVGSQAPAAGDPAAGPATAPEPGVVIGDGSEIGPAPDESPGADSAGEAPPPEPPGQPPPDAPPSGDAYGDGDPSALTDFGPSLAPYGTWADDSAYGTVWRPSPDVVGDDFEPYVSAGHWAYDDDYVWVSDYDWGWVPFHYGRWVYGPGAGWEWIPGRSYAGAWVSWRIGGGYVGWAPLAPTWGWRGGAPALLRTVATAPPYAFVGTRDLFARSVGQRVIGGSSAMAIAANTHPVVAASSEAARGLAGVRAGGGPAPATLGIASGSVPHTTAADRGVVQARAFARPSTALALGARAPEGAPAHAWSRGAWRPSTTLGHPSSAAGSSYPLASHFGGRLGVGFTGSPNAAGPMRAPAAVQGRPYFGSPRSGTASPYRGSYRGPTSPPVYRAYDGARPAGGSTMGAGSHSGTSPGSTGSRGGGGRSGGGRGGGRR